MQREKTEAQEVVFCCVYLVWVAQCYKEKREGRRVGRRGVSVRGSGEGEGLAREGEGEAVSEPTVFENQA